MRGESRGPFNPLSNKMKPFFGEVNAKAKRKALEEEMGKKDLRLRHFVEVVFNLSLHPEILETWVKEHAGDGITWGVCGFCAHEAPFFGDVCLFCTERERGIEMAESEKAKEDEAARALAAGEPFMYMGRVLANGKCDLHPENGGESHVLTIHTNVENSLHLCGACARLMLQRLVVDYWRETRNLQAAAESRIFWGKDPLLKDGDGIITLDVAV